MKKWFTIDTIDEDTYCISEYRHWEETHCYLLNGSEGSLLIDTGLGICDIHEEVEKLTDRPVTAVATHIHWGSCVIKGRSRLRTVFAGFPPGYIVPGSSVLRILVGRGK